MPKQMRFNAFTMNTVGHISPGMWTHPRDQSHRYTDIGHWSELARTLERGKFDGVFIADVLGIYDVYEGNRDHPIRHAVQVPVNDPMLIVPVMAAVTEHLGFGVTASVSYEHPFPFARRMSTLDHLTKGRIAWNIVTSYLDSGARATGQQRLLDHDARYDYAEEYADICYRLWEASWDDDAVKRDKASGVFADPGKVHEIRHSGVHFTVDATHLSEPSPQRTPVLYQAGASGRGRKFAARHAEAVFVGGPTKTILKGYVDSIRASAIEAGRAATDVQIYNMHTLILGKTDADAKRKHDEYRHHVDYAASLTLLSGWMGIDLSKYALDEPLRHVKTNAGQSAVESFSSADPARTWTVREIAEWVAIGGRGPISVGSPATIADELEGWMSETGIDGFNLGCAVMPETFVDIVDLLVPELQRRGLYKTDYAPGSYRDKLFGRGPRLAPTHPGAQWRAGVSAPLPHREKVYRARS